MTLNPNTPTIVGPEWFAYRQRGLQIDRNRLQAAVLTPGAIATDDIVVNLRNVDHSPLVAAEITKVSDLTTAGAVTTTDTFRPTADFTVTDARHGLAGTTVAPFYVDIDEVTKSTVDFVSQDVTTNGVWAFSYGSGAFTGRRVLSISLRGWVRGDATVSPWLQVGGVTTYLPSFNVSTGLGLGIVPLNDFGATTFTVNSATGLPFTVADVVALASSGGVGFDFACPTQPNRLAWYQGWIEVVSVAETRLAFGSATATADGWLVIPMATPAGVDTWTPTAATAYATILTVGGNGSASWRGLDSGALHPEGNYSVPVTLSVDGFPSSLGATDTAAPGIVGLSTAGYPVWGQPYVDITEEPIYTGRTVEQELTLPDTASRGSLRSVVRQQSSATTASLSMKLKRRSDNVQIGGTATVTPFDIRDEPRFAQALWLPGASGAAGSAVQHYVEWSSTAPTGNGWLLTTISGVGSASTEGLTTNQQGLETDTTGWAAGANTTIARSTAQFYAGAASLSLVSTAGSGNRTATTPTGVSGVPAVAGQTIVASAQVLSTLSRSARLNVAFYTAAGALISTTTGGSFTTSISAWTLLSTSVTAPATTAFVTLIWEVLAVNAETHYGDQFSVLRTSAFTPLLWTAGVDLATVAGVDVAGRLVPVVTGTTRVAPGSQTVNQT